MYHIFSQKANENLFLRINMTKNVKSLMETPLAPLTISEQKATDKLIAAWDKTVSSQAAQTFSDIEFGILAIKTKIAHPKSFNRMADYEEHIPKKELHRCMSLVLKDPKVLRKALKISGKNVDIAKNTALLVIDSKIADMTLNGMANMIEPTKEKIDRMKLNLSDTDFKAVLGGNDTSYNAHMESLKSDKVKAHNGQKPNGMDTVRFEALFKGDKYALITLVYDYENNINIFEKQIETLKLEKEKLQGKIEAYSEMQTVRAGIIPEKIKNKKVA